MADIIGGTVVWNLDVDNTKLKSGLASAKSDIEKAGKDINGSVGSIRSSISGIGDAFRNAQGASVGFGVAITGIGVGLGSMFKSTLESAKGMELLRSSFDTLTGSVEKGGDLFEKVFNFAAQTPFETPELAKATQTMLGYGIAIEEVMPNLQMLGDISLGNKDNLQGLTRAFAQTSATGRLMGQDLLQMINSGFNPLQSISEKTGKSIGELKEEMEDGAISVDMVRDAMVTATSEGGRFFKGMERGSKTITGLQSTFNDFVGMTTRGLLGLSKTGEIVQGSLLDKLRVGFEGLNKVLSQNQEQIQKFFGDFFGVIIDNAPIIIGLIVGGLVPAFAALAISMAPLLPFIAIGAAVGLAIKLIVDAMGGWEQVMAKLKPVLEFMGDFFNTVLLPMFKSMWEQINNNIIPALKALWEVLSPVLIPVLKVVAVIIGGVVLGAIMAFTAALWVIVTTIRLVADNVKNTVNGIKDHFKNMVSGISSVMSGLANILTRPFIDAWNSIKGYADKIRNALNEINPFTRHSPSLVDNVIRGVDIIRSEFKSLADLSISPVASMAPQQLYSPSVLNTGMADTPSGLQSKGSVTVNIGQANIKNQSDIEALGREFGFRYTLAK